MKQPDYYELLSEVIIDNFYFKVTWHPSAKQFCILWFRDCYVTTDYVALGQFSKFDKRQILDFIVRFATNPSLRDKIDEKRFKQRLEQFPKTFFRRLQRMSLHEREEALKELFELDDEIERKDLVMKRRILAKKYHPDAGGDARIMSIINEAYNNFLENC